MLEKRAQLLLVFPICISVNVIVGHFSRLANDETVLEEGDMLKIDISCHIDGVIVVVAHTHVLQEGPVSGRAADVIDAVHIVAVVTLRLVRPRRKNKDVTDTIQKVVVAYDCKIFEGVRHQLKQFVIDGNQVVSSHFDAYVAPIYIPLSFPLLVVCVLDSDSLLFQWFPWMHFECRRVFDCLVDARELFEKMPYRGVQSWNAMFLVFDEWPLQGVFEPFDKGIDYLAEVEYDIVVVILGLFGNILVVVACLLTISLPTIMSSRSELTRIWDPGDAQVASGGGRVQITVSWCENAWEVVNVLEEPILRPLDRGWKNGMVGNHLVWLYSIAIQPEFTYLPSPFLPMFWRFPDIQHDITRLFHRPTNPFEFIVAIQANLWAGKQLQEIHLNIYYNDRTMKLLPNQVDTTVGGWHCNALTDEGQVYGGEIGDSWVGFITVYKAIVQLDEMHDAYEKLLKEAE